MSVQKRMLFLKIGLCLLLVSVNSPVGWRPVRAQEAGNANQIVPHPLNLHQFERSMPERQSAVLPILSSDQSALADLTPHLGAQQTSSYIGVPKGLSVPVQQNYGYAFNIEPPDRPDFFLFGEQITPQIYPASLTSVLYASLNSAIKDEKGNAFPSAAGAKVRVTVFTSDTDADLSRASIDNIKQADFTITKDFSSPDQIRSYADFNEFDTSDVSISKGSFFVLIQLIGIGSSNLSPDGSDFLFLADIQDPSKAVISVDDGRSLSGVGVKINTLPVDFLIVGRLSLPSGTVPPPEIQGIKLAKDSLTVVGTQLTLTGNLSVNTQVISPPLTTRLKKNGRLRVSGTQDQFNLKKGNNEIVFTNGNLSSPSYRYKLN